MVLNEALNVVIAQGYEKVGEIVMRMRGRPLYGERVRAAHD
jgi:hypothetical protein